MNHFYDIFENFKNKGCHIPLNDTEAFTIYTNHNKVYNKLEIFKFQNIECNPFPCKPSKFPIVSKPIINLFGMGLNAKKINNVKQFNRELPSNNFWCSFLEGEHLSWDFVVRNGKIVYHVCFKGGKKEFATFKYWTLMNIDILENIRKIIDFYLTDFTGTVNMETIGNFVIETHLRIGDAKFCEKEIIDLFLSNYFVDDEKFTEKLDIAKSIVNRKVNLIPVWEKLNDEIKIKRKYNRVKKNIEPILQEDDMVIDFYYPCEVRPEKYHRWYLLFMRDLKYGLKLAKTLEKKIKKL